MQASCTAYTSTQKPNSSPSLNLSSKNSRPSSIQQALSQILVNPMRVHRIATCSGISPRVTPRTNNKKLSREKKISRRMLISPQPSTKIDIRQVEKGIQIRRLHGKREVSSNTRGSPDKERLTNSISRNNHKDFYNRCMPYRDSFLIIQKSQMSIYQIRNRQKRDSTSGTSSIETHIESYSMRKNTPVIRTRTPKKIEKAALKDAVKDKEWLAKAKPQLLKAFYSHINKSNGIEITIPSDNYWTYKYYIGKGNNSKLIKQCLKTRWWWTRVSKNDMDSANLIWTQWKNQEFLLSLGKNMVPHEIESQSPIAISTNIRYYDTESKPLLVDVAGIGFNYITRSPHFAMLKTVNLDSSKIKMHNKMEHNYHLANKKALFFNLRCYYEIIGQEVFDVVPITYHVKHVNDQSFKEFELCFRTFEVFIDEQGKRLANLWIVKPGENSNRGNGICVCNTFEEVKEIVKSLPVSAIGQKTYIIQKYIENPFLVHKRKFDIRCFALVTGFNGVIQGYFFTEGYLRTTSKPFSLSVTNRLIHLTNDAVQKYAEDYGKFENGNKMSYTDFQRYLDTYTPEKGINFLEDILPKIKHIVTDTIKSVFLKIDLNRREHSFEIFGYDFLLDCDLKPWLIEVNTNPCLELSSPHLSRIIPNMIENALRICLDPIFQEPSSYLKRTMLTNDIPENKFELVFSSTTVDELLLEKLLKALSTDENEIYDESYASDTSCIDD